MIFGLFKKNDTADAVFKGGRIYTLDGSEEPSVEAVACKDGKIISVGDENIISNYIGKETDVIDLEGGTLLPGFIDICGRPVLRSAQTACLILKNDMDLERALSVYSEFINDNPDLPGYFAYGLNPEYTANKAIEETQLILDNICIDKPIALMDSSGFKCWFNTNAVNQIKEAAEADETKIVTVPYSLRVIAPVDFEVLQKAVVDIAAEYCGKGYTTVFDRGAPEYLHGIYQEMLVEMLQADMLKQRFIGSFLVVKNIPPEYVTIKLSQKRTSCAEIEEYISCDTIKATMSAGDGAGTSINISPDFLDTLAKSALDNGFNLHVDVPDESSVSKAFEAISQSKSSIVKKSHFTIAHSGEYAPRDDEEYLMDEDIRESVPTPDDYNIKYIGASNAKDTSGAINALTVEAAAILNISDNYGSIEVGKRADFVIFKEDPYNLALSEFLTLTSLKTIIDGKVVYTAGEDDPDQWVEILKESQFETQGFAEGDWD